MYQDSSLFSIVTNGREDVLATGNPSRKRYNWKGKCEAMKLRCYAYQKDLYELQGKAKLVKTLQEEAKIQCSPTTIVTHVVELEPSLQVEKKQHEKAFYVVAKVNFDMDEDQKILQKELEARAQTLKTFKGEMDGLREKLCDSLQQSIQDVLGVRDQVVEHAKGFSPEATIHVEMLDPFKDTLNRDSKGYSRILALGVAT